MLLLLNARYILSALKDELGNNLLDEVDSPLTSYEIGTEPVVDPPVETPSVVLLGGGPGKSKPSLWGKTLLPQKYDTEPVEEAVEAVKAVASQVDPEALARSLSISKQATEATRQSLNAAMKAADKARAQEQMLAQLREALIAEQQQAQALFDQDEDDALCVLLLTL